jgi:MoxR-like ATPase
MSIALLIESEIESGKEQTLVVPTNTEVLMFHRLSNGQRGRGQRWQSVKTTDELPMTFITSEPKAVLISARDVATAEIGNVTALAVKLLAVESKPANEVFPIAHSEMVGEVVEQLLAGDPELNAYVSDGRLRNPITFSPIGVNEPIMESAFYPVLAPEVSKPVEVAPAPIAQAPIPAVSAPRKAEVELARIPDKKWAEEYLNRKVVNGKTDFDILDVAKANKQNVLIRGHAGSGKTMCILAWASARQYRYYNISANVGLEPSHLFGAWTPTEQAGVFKWQDGAVTDLVRHGGVLLLNEIDFMPERITTVLFGLLDDRREIQLLENGGEVIKAHPDLVVIGDHNPNYRGSRPMNQAWKDRFAHKLEFDYDKSIEKKLIKSASLLDVAQKLRDQAHKGELDTPVSTRGLMSFCRNVANVGLDYAVTSYVNGFSDDEREAVKLVFDTAKSGIASDFGITIKTAPIQSDEA